MPVELERKTHMIRITNPHDDSEFVDVKIIDEISFIDLHEQGQEYRYRFDNHQDNTFRMTRTVTVTGDDGMSTVDVEVIDQFNMFDLQSRGQESGFRLTGNANVPPIPPPEVHYQTHEFTVYNPDAPHLSITLQRIDQIRFSDPHELGQETFFVLQNPDDDMSNPSSVDTSDDGSSINPPWRLDPFQNIVNVHWSRSGEGSGTATTGALLGASIQWSALFSSISATGGDITSGPRESITSVIIHPDGSYTIAGNFPGTVAGVSGSGGDRPKESGDVAPYTPIYSVAGTSVTFGMNDGDGNPLLGPYIVDYSGVSIVSGPRTYHAVRIVGAVFDNSADPNTLTYAVLLE